MALRHIFILFALPGFAGCADLDGVFEPACIAFEGDTVVLRDGRFEWHKFTDERRIDDEGNDVDPFPGYPVKGSYELSRKKVEFHSDSGDRLADYYLVEHEGALYLLTADQNTAVTESDAIPSCALRRNEDGSSN